MYHPIIVSDRLSFNLKKNRRSMMPTREVIYETGHLTAIHRDYGSDWVCVTFNEMGHVASSGEFWGERLFEQFRLSVVGIVSARPNWYPLEDTLAAIKIVNAAIGQKKVITYGFSQGGYGALKFSRLLNAAAALSFCPQWSIDPAFVESFDKRFTGYYQAHLNNGSPISSDDLCGKALVFLDPRETVDHVHATKLAEFGAERIPAYFSGHETVRLLSESGLSAAFLTSFISALSHDQPFAARQWVRQTRSRSTTYVGNLLRTLARKKKHSAAIKVVEALSPSMKAYGLTMFCATCGDFRAAALHLDSISNQELQNLGLRNLWTAFRAVAFKVGELHISRLISQVVHDDLFLRLHAVQTYVDCGLASEARQELCSLHDSFDCTRYLGHIRSFERRIQAIAK